MGGRGGLRRNRKSLAGPESIPNGSANKRLAAIILLHKEYGSKCPFNNQRGKFGTKPGR